MDIRKLLGKLDQLNEGTMAQAKSKPTGPKFGKGKWKGTDTASAAKDKYVGEESILRDLEAKLNEDPVKRDLSKEFKEFKEGATGAKPGWMLRQDPVLAKKVKDSKSGHQALKKWAGKPVPKDNKPGVDEAYDHNAPFNAADFRRHMKDLEAREQLRKTDPVSAKALDLRGQLPQQSKKKPDDDSMSTSDPRHPQYAYTQAGQQGVAEDVDAHWIPDVVALLGKLVASSKAQAKYNVEPEDIPDVKEFINLLSAGNLDAARDHWSMMEWNDLDNALEYFVRKNGLPHVWLHKLLGEQGIDESPEEALKYATQAHAGQTRSGGDPYISHPVRVANHIKQYKQSHNLDALISAAYLHDTIEDTDTTHEALHDLFGGLVASLVKELTSDPEQIKKMGKAAYLSHKMAAMSSYALVIKLADRLDNVKDITTARTPQWRAKYAAETNQILNYIEKNRALSSTHNKLIGLIRAKLAEINNPQQGVAEGSLNEFAPGNGDDGLPHAEYQVYQCNPLDQFDWIGGPLYQTDNMGMAHKYAYEKYVKHRPKAFMVWQERSQGSRGNYGVKGESDHDEDLKEFAEGFSELDLAVMEGGHELVKEAPVAPVQAGAAPAPVAGKPTLGTDLTKPAAQQAAQQQQQTQKAQQAAAQKAKQEQATLTKGVNSLKTAGAAVSNPNQVVKAFDKAQNNQGLTPADKNSIASAGTVLAPIMANPQLQGKFKDLVTQASAEQMKAQQQAKQQPQAAVGAPVAGQVK